MKKPTAKELKIALCVIEHYKVSFEEFAKNYKSADMSKDAETLKFAQIVLVHAATR